MKRKYKIKQLDRSTEFSKLSGIDSYENHGGFNCAITRALTFSKKEFSYIKIPAPKYAYYIYNGIHDNNGDIRVKTTCGVQNCVTKDHLIPEYFPNKKDIEYINTYLKIDGIEVIAHNLKVPIDLLENYLAKKK